MPMQQAETTVSPSGLVEMVEGCLERTGVVSETATDTARYLVDADMLGVHSHGVDMLPSYFEGYERGELNPLAVPEVVHEFAAVSVVDANNGLGFTPSHKAMSLAIEAARNYGIGVSVARSSNHFGMASHWTRQAVAAGMIGFATTNGPPVMAPWGARDALLCNNPISWGIPAREQPSVIFDVACSASSRGKIRLAALNKKPIPEGWALGSDGRPTTDPEKALEGVLLPFSEHKGSGFAIVNEILASALSGARALTEVPAITPSSYGYHPSWKIGHFFMAIDPSSFGESERVLERVDRVVGAIRESRPIPGVERVKVPGEASTSRYEQSQRRGISLPQSVRRKIKRFLHDAGMKSLLPEGLDD